jgi:hypothetical protein
MKTVWGDGALERPRTVEIRGTSSVVEPPAQTRVTYGFHVNLMSQNSPSSVASHSRQLPIFGKEQSIYTLHNMLQSIYLLPSILGINYN